MKSKVVGVVAFASGVSLLWAAPASAEPDAIKSRVPQAHIDALMTKCGADAPRATCWCVVKKLNETADGQVTLDLMGLAAGNPKPPQPDVVKMLNRHGMRPSQAKAAVDRSGAMLEAAFKDCG